MRLSEKDFIFFIGSIIGLIGGPIIVAILMYRLIFMGEKVNSIKLTFVLSMFSVGFVVSYKHARYCWRVLRNR